ncbi:hypothetical protein QIA30_06330 (plasmid) [Borreliella turdi]
MLRCVNLKLESMSFLVKNHYAVFQEILGEFQNAIAIDVESAAMAQVEYN